MSWLTHHQNSEEAASEAHAARRRGDEALATSLFAAAAQAELLALKHLSLADKPRTFGITAVSSAALLYKAEQPREAEQLAHSMLGQPGQSVRGFSPTSETSRDTRHQEQSSEGSFLDRWRPPPESP